mmetsp:Transcript_33535/g.44758  ORF Transcript_33535/g.44758 Transcript_33535/m.44758 type:complete len:110 (-) Transcript_33535:177-506(-)
MCQNFLSSLTNSNIHFKKITNRSFFHNLFFFILDKITNIVCDIFQLYQKPRLLDRYIYTFSKNKNNQKGKILPGENICEVGYDKKKHLLSSSVFCLSLSCIRSSPRQHL